MERFSSCYEISKEDLDRIYKIVSLFNDRFDRISDELEEDNLEQCKIRLSESKRAMKEVVSLMLQDISSCHKFVDERINDIVNYCNIRMFVEENRNNDKITKEKKALVDYDHFLKVGLKGPATAYISDDGHSKEVLYSHHWDAGDWIFVIE